MIRRGDNWAGGFTLMEVVTAVFIFLLGIVGVISLFTAAAVFHKGASDRTRVSLALQQVICEIDDRLKRGAYRDAGGELTSCREVGIPGYERMGYEAEFEETGRTGESMVIARVSVTWLERGKTKRETFDHVFRPGPALYDAIADFKADQRRESGAAREDE